MNATPRTDAALEWVRPAGNDCGPPNEQYVCADFARELERELARLRAELSAVQAQHLHEIDELAAQAKIMNALRAEVERLKGLASWANTCIHHNDAERARYGHVCLVCTSTRAEKAEKLWKEFITLMEITEESDYGNAFNPNKISSCRAMDGKRLNEILIEARQIVF